MISQRVESKRAGRADKSQANFQSIVTKIDDNSSSKEACFENERFTGRIT